jgi:hypothetical protein
MPHAVSHSTDGGSGAGTDVPTSYALAMRSKDAGEWEAAMHDEFAAISKARVWTPTNLPAGDKAIGSKWVYDQKRDEWGNKARLVAQGFTQREGIDYNLTFAPVAKYTTMRVLLAMACQEDWELDQLDVKSAFLHGLLDEKIYLRPPNGHPTYGTGQVPLFQGLVRPKAGQPGLEPAP